jgi:hypothetical protein
VLSVIRARFSSLPFLVFAIRALVDCNGLPRRRFNNFSVQDDAECIAHKYASRCNASRRTEVVEYCHDITPIWIALPINVKMLEDERGVPVLAVCVVYRNHAHAPWQCRAAYHWPGVSLVITTTAVPSELPRVPTLGSLPFHRWIVRHPSHAFHATQFPHRLHRLLCTSRVYRSEDSNRDSTCTAIVVISYTSLPQGMSRCTCSGKLVYPITTKQKEAFCELTGEFSTYYLPPAPFRPLCDVFTKETGVRYHTTSRGGKNLERTTNKRSINVTVNGDSQREQEAASMRITKLSKAGDKQREAFCELEDY